MEKPTVHRQIDSIYFFNYKNQEENIENDLLFIHQTLKESGIKDLGGTVNFQRRRINPSNYVPCVESQRTALN